MKNSEYIITVDLGGTKILSALLNSENEIVGKVKQPTDSSKGADFIVECIVESISKLFDNHKVTEKNIKAIAMGVPGTVNPISGLLSNAPNLGIKDFNIKEALQKSYNIPVLLENDVNLAALGIKKYEFEDKVNNMLVVFIGTGIGGALIFDGKIYRGTNFFAGEIGHMKVNRKGEFIKGKNAKSFEMIASRTAIVESINKKLKKGSVSNILEFAKDDKIKSSALANAVESGDKLVLKEIKKACKVIGSVLGSITTLLNIDTIVLGGGVVEAMDDFILPEVQKSFMKIVLAEPGKDVKIIATNLGDDAPLYGGIALVEEFLS
ncbi:MAG: ROK family protein [Bacteroidetes bacterium]|nr:ROK family protein [Bacteroidota bacterium]MBU1800284.1 ROK family protein [Bacteroidota bacterium]